MLLENPILKGKSLAPQRIISLVPSQTELLFDLGLADKIVGITKFCVHPSSGVAGKKIIGGTKNIRIDDIYELKPDLIIANREENKKDQILEIAKSFPVWVSQVRNLTEAYDMILSIGHLTGTTKAAKYLLNRIKNEMDLFEKWHQMNESPFVSALYMIWNKPMMAAGQNTFINSMMELCGLRNAVKESGYPIITEKKINALQPDLILLSSEPFPYSGKHIPSFKVMVPESKVICVNGEFYSWYGSRMALAPKYFTDLLNGFSIRH